MSNASVADRRCPPSPGPMPIPLPPSLPRAAAFMGFPVAADTSASISLLRRNQANVSLPLAAPPPSDPATPCFSPRPPMFLPLSSPLWVISLSPLFPCLPDATASVVARSRRSPRGTPVERLISSFASSSGCCSCCTRDVINVVQEVEPEGALCWAWTVRSGVGCWVIVVCSTVDGSSSGRLAIGLPRTAVRACRATTGSTTLSVVASTISARMVSLNSRKASMSAADLTAGAVRLGHAHL